VAPFLNLLFLAAAAVLFGFMAGTICNFATQLKFALGYDDTLDIFATHGIGGVVGNVSFRYQTLESPSDVLQALDRPLRPGINRWPRRLYCNPRRLARSKLHPARLAAGRLGYGFIVLFRYDGKSLNRLYWHGSRN